MSALTSVPVWLTAALGEIDQREIVGSKHSPRVLQYHATTTLRASTDEVPWCSAFVQWCIAKAGFIGTRSAAARSWLQWGRELDEPRLGCIVVFKRGAPPSGHVAFFIAERGESVYVLGGNQSNRVSIAAYSKRDVLGYRWPKSIA